MMTCFCKRMAIALLLLIPGILILTSCRQNILDIQPVPSTEALPLATSLPAVAPSVPEPEQELLSWQRLDTTGGGGQTGIATHPTNPDIVYMASDNGGLFKTENGGDTWFSVSSNLGAYRLGFVTLDPLNPEVIYVTAATDYGLITSGGATGEIYRSLNGGLSWEFLSDHMGFQNSFPNQVSIVIPYDPDHPGRFDQDNDGLSDVIVVGAWSGPADPPVGGIWRSEDEGQTFTHQALQDRNSTALRAFAGDVNVLFLTTHEGEVYRSEDLGQGWVDVTGNMPLAHPSDLAVHPTNKDILYITCRWCQAGEPPVWKTTDGGQNWHPAATGLDSNEIRSFPRILMDRFDPNTLYVTTLGAPADKGGVYKSTDGGNKWHLMPARLVLPDGRPYYWYQFEGGLTIGQAIDGRLFAGGGGGWRYPDGDVSDGLEMWEPATLGIGNVHVNTIEVDPLDDTILYQGISDFGPYKSIDRGLSFHRILGNGWPVTVDNFVWNGPYYSNYRKCWLRCSASCKERRRVAAGGTTDFAISRQDPNIVYSSFGSGSGRSNHGGVNKSTDGGKTWQPVGFQLKHGFELNPETCVPYGFRHLAIDPTNDNILFAAMEIPPTQTGKLYRTTDGGETWSEVYSASSYVTGIEVSALDPDLIIFTTQTDVYKSEQGGGADSWQVITPPGDFHIRAVELSPHKVGVYVLGTNDHGIYYTADGGIAWRHNPLEDLFAQRLYHGSDQHLDAAIATALNPKARILRNISAIVFDPVTPDVFYVAGTQYSRASFGVAKITNAAQNWQRLPLEGLAHRNIFDLAIDSSGTFLYAGTFDGTYRLRLREP
ncbi:MAG TPA: hypothetical protein EYP10_08815 [Armatimonadetes bacterium]|nr:hypothetical protein [Armatimonadota bacterium]